MQLHFLTNHWILSSVSSFASHPTYYLGTYDRRPSFPFSFFLALGGGRGWNCIPTNKKREEFSFIHARTWVLLDSTKKRNYFLTHKTRKKNQIKVFLLDFLFWQSSYIRDDLSYSMFKYFFRLHFSFYLIWHNTYNKQKWNLGLKPPFCLFGFHYG